MNKFFVLFIALALLAGCQRNTPQVDALVSMQMIDRNGFAETISNRDRLIRYENVDFLVAQPYQKVLRVFAKDNQGKSYSKLTSYHSNGGVWQYLEAINGRAHGRYLEWHENGKMKIEAHLIEGLADLTELAQKTWLFDQECSVWDEQGHLEAEFLYDKGHLEGQAKYFYPSGKLHRVIPYTHGHVDGALTVFNEEGGIIEEIHYKKGEREGAATASWSNGQSKYQENYRNDLLIHGIYFDPHGKEISEVENGLGIRADFAGDKIFSLTSYKNGVVEGEVQLFDDAGHLQSSYWIVKGKKTGEEWEYYPLAGESLKPKLMINWFEDKIQGMVKTWYETGALESQRELSGNKKQGLCFAYYKSGDLMLMEEYDNDRLVKGSYFRKGEPTPISLVEKGEGIATLYNPDGHLHDKITYEHGKPVVK